MRPNLTTREHKAQKCHKLIESIRSSSWFPIEIVILRPAEEAQALYYLNAMLDLHLPFPMEQITPPPSNRSIRLCRWIWRWIYSSLDYWSLGYEPVIIVLHGS